MSTKLKRYSVSLPEQIQSLIEKDAAFNRRPVANQIMWILDQWFMERKKELDYFTPTQLAEEGRPKVPVFGTKDRPDTELASKIHDVLGREKS